MSERTLGFQEILYCKWKVTKSLGDAGGINRRVPWERAAQKGALLHHSSSLTGLATLVWCPGQNTCELLA